MIGTASPSKPESLRKKISHPGSGMSDSGGGGDYAMMID